MQIHGETPCRQRFWTEGCSQSQGLWATVKLPDAACSTTLRRTGLARLLDIKRQENSCGGAREGA